MGMAHAATAFPAKAGKAGLGDLLGRRDTLRLAKVNQLTNQKFAGKSMMVKKKDIAMQSLYNLNPTSRANLLNNDSAQKDELGDDSFFN